MTVVLIGLALVAGMAPLVVAAAYTARPDGVNGYEQATPALRARAAADPHLAGLLDEIDSGRRRAEGYR